MDWKKHVRGVVNLISDSPELSVLILLAFIFLIIIPMCGGMIALVATGNWLWVPVLLTVPAAILIAIMWVIYKAHEE